MLLNNYTWRNSNPGRAIGGFSNLTQNFKPGCLINFFDSDDFLSPVSVKASLPAGTEPPYSFDLALKGGELSSVTYMSGDGELTGAMAQGINLGASLSGVGTLVSPVMKLITALNATLTGIGTVTASMVGTIQMAATLAGTGNLTASMKVIAGMVANLVGIGSVSANLKGKANMSATIYVNSGAATTAELVAAIWGALAAAYNDSGTMGEKLNGAGSAGDPWTTDLDGYTTEGTAGKVLKDKLSTDDFLALK